MRLIDFRRAPLEEVKVRLKLIENAQKNLRTSNFWGYCRLIQFSREYFKHLRKRFGFAIVRRSTDCFGGFTSNRSCSGRIVILDAKSFQILNFDSIKGIRRNSLCA